MLLQVLRVVLDVVLRMWPGGALRVHVLVDSDADGGGRRALPVHLQTEGPERDVVPQLVVAVQRGRQRAPARPAPAAPRAAAARHPRGSHPQRGARQVLPATLRTRKYTLQSIGGGGGVQIWGARPRGQFRLNLTWPGTH